MNPTEAECRIMPITNANLPKGALALIDTSAESTMAPKKLFKTLSCALKMLNDLLSKPTIMAFITKLFPVEGDVSVALKYLMSLYVQSPAISADDVTSIPAVPVPSGFNAIANAIIKGKFDGDQNVFVGCLEFVQAVIVYVAGYTDRADGAWEGVMESFLGAIHSASASRLQTVNVALCVRQSRESKRVFDTLMSIVNGLVDRANTDTSVVIAISFINNTICTGNENSARANDGVPAVVVKSESDKKNNTAQPADVKRPTNVKQPAPTSSSNGNWIEVVNKQQSTSAIAHPTVSSSGVQLNTYQISLDSVGATSVPRMEGRMVLIGHFHSRDPAYVEAAIKYVSQDIDYNMIMAMLIRIDGVLYVGLMRVLPIDNGKVRADYHYKNIRFVSPFVLHINTHNLVKDIVDNVKNLSSKNRQLSESVGWMCDDQCGTAGYIGFFFTGTHDGTNMLATMFKELQNTCLFNLQAPMSKRVNAFIDYCVNVFEYRTTDSNAKNWIACMALSVNAWETKDVSNLSELIERLTTDLRGDIKFIHSNNIERY